ncbi:hypothetical protein KBZ10_15930 [Streptomyces sp. F63]|uniref:hypothetical protein n=1 Tax=Streptomyces sp. F63 TaxID=2824887 RepID=UPI001B374106|nr:hypothetical protein [Streptomyces sp. F63]MBQ0985981.1 hypothetical protein [Streptomyces sp. F63]
MHVLQGVEEEDQRPAALPGFPVGLPQGGLVLLRVVPGPADALRPVAETPHVGLVQGGQDHGGPQVHGVDAEFDQPPDDPLAGERRLVPAAFLYDAGLIARYWDEGGHAFLTGLQHAARRPDEAPHGLWLLCPVESRVQIPHLDGRTVEVIGGDGEQVYLNGEFLGALTGGGDQVPEAAGGTPRPRGD